MWQDIYEDDFDNGNNWEISIDNKTLEYFEEKEEAISYLLDSIDSLINESFYENLSLIGYENVEDLFEMFMVVSEMEFYELLDNIKHNFNIKVNYNLINHNGDEPEFGIL